MEKQAEKNFRILDDANLSGEFAVTIIVVIYAVSSGIAEDGTDSFNSAGSAASLTCPPGAVAPHQPPYDLRRKIYYLTSLGPNWAAAAPRKRQRRTGSSSPEEPLCLDSALMSLEPVLPTSASVGSSSPLGQNEASMEGEETFTDHPNSHNSRIMRISSF